MNGDREREVAESACINDRCGICAIYVRTGDSACRPVTRDEYMAALRRSYPDTIPVQVLPKWAAPS